jgi:hypothetical protein
MGVSQMTETSGYPALPKARQLDPKKHCSGKIFFGCWRYCVAFFSSLRSLVALQFPWSLPLSLRSLVALQFPWSLPLQMAPRKDGSCNPCSDYKWLNLVTIHNECLFPSLLDLSSRLHRVLYFGPKTLPPPPLSEIFFPPHNRPFFNSYCTLFSLILPYFALILPFYFLFSLFLSPLSFFFLLSSFLLFIFPLFLFPFSYFFPQMTSVDIRPGVIYQYIDP